MLQSITQTLGPWAWIIFGLLLLIVEIFLPGVYFIWFGLAAATTGILSLIFWEQAFWAWQLQGICFALLSLIYVLLARRYFKSAGEASDEPLLNNREASLIGRTATLTEAITNGYGRVKLDDSTWRVTGEDAPLGSRVLITGADAQVLRVEPVETT